MNLRGKSLEQRDIAFSKCALVCFLYRGKNARFFCFCTYLFVGAGKTSLWWHLWRQQGRTLRGWSILPSPFVDRCNAPTVLIYDCCRPWFKSRGMTCLAWKMPWRRDLKNGGQGGKGEEREALRRKRNFSSSSQMKSLASRIQSRVIYHKSAVASKLLQIFESDQLLCFWLISAMLVNP